MLTLIKYDMIELGKKVLPAWLFITVLVIGQHFLVKLDLGPVQVGLSKFIATIAPVAVLIVLFFSSIFWFKRVMFTRRAYLTFTLPRKISSTVISKFLVTFIYCVFGGILTAILFKISFDLLDISKNFKDSMEITMNMSSIRNTMIYFLLNRIVTTFTGIAMIYMVISVAMLLNKMRGFFGFILFMFLNFVIAYSYNAFTKTLFYNGSVKPIDAGAGSGVNILSDMGKYSQALEEGLRTGLISSIIFYGILVVIYVSVVTLICNRKINV